MKRILPFLATITLSAHTLVLVQWDQHALLNAEFTSEKMGRNGDGKDAFAQKLYPVSDKFPFGNTNAPDNECWTWCAASFKPAHRGELSKLAVKAENTETLKVFEYDSAAEPDFPHKKAAELGLALPQAELLSVVETKEP